MRQEIVDREFDEDTRLQMQKRRREGHIKRRAGQGGKEFEIARLDPRKHRTGSRAARKVQRARDVINEDDADELEGAL